MKILAPLNNLNNLEKFINLGADEFYLGYEDQEWNQLFGQYEELNKMSSIKGSDITEWRQLPLIIKEIKKTGKKCFITINGFSYTNKQIEFIDGRFEKMSKMGIDGLIIGAPELFPVARKYNLNVHASSMTNCYNNFLVQYYKNKGVTRIIFPRDLTLNDIINLKRKNSTTEFEVFIMRIGCKYSDPNCLCLHGGKYGGICGYLKKSDRILYSDKKSFKDKHDFLFTNDLYENFFHSFPACGLCAIYDFVNGGIDACKIVGRYENTDEVAEDIRLVKQNIEIAKNCKSKKEYLDKMQVHTLHKRRCYLSLGCYYPEVRF